MEHVSCTVILVSTGGKSYNSVIFCKLYIVIEVGTGLQLLQELQIVSAILKINIVGIRVSGGDVAAEQIDTVVLAGSVDIHEGVLLVVVLLPVVGDGGEHGAVLHVVAINQSVVAAEVGCTAVVNKHGAAGVAAVVKSTVEVVIIIIGLSNRVGDNGLGVVDPGLNIIVAFMDSLEINRQGRYIGIILGLLGFGGGAGIFACLGVSGVCTGLNRWGGGSGGYKLITHVIIFAVSFAVLADDGVDFIAAEHKNAKENIAQNYKQ